MWICGHFETSVVIATDATLCLVTIFYAIQLIKLNFITLNCVAMAMPLLPDL